jgi:hypothetical protein
VGCERADLERWPLRYTSSSEFSRIVIANASSTFFLSLWDPAHREDPCLGIVQPCDGDHTHDVMAPEILPKWTVNGLADARPSVPAFQFLINNLHCFELAEEVDEPLVRESYGLDPPALSLRIDTTSGSEEIRFGSRNEYLGMRYVELASRPGRMYLSIEQLFAAANKPALEFLQRRVLPASSPEVARVTVERAGHRLDFLRSDRWRFTAGGLRADPERVEELFGTLAALEIAALPSLEERHEPGGPAHTRIRLDLIRGEVVVVDLALSAVEGAGLVGRLGRGSWFPLSPPSLDVLDRPVEWFRDRTPVRLPVEDVACIRWTRAGASLEARRLATGWQVNGRPASPSRLRFVLVQMNELQAEGLPSGVELGADRVVVSVAIEPPPGFPGREELELELGRTPEGDTCLRLREPLEVFRLDVGDWERLIPDEEWLCAIEANEPPGNHETRHSRPTFTAGETSSEGD